MKYLLLLTLYVLACYSRRRTISTKTSGLFQKLADYDLIHFDKEHSASLFHHFEKRYYPMAGSVKFDAFGQHFHIKLEKHVDLLGKDFKVHNSNGTHKFQQPFDIEKDNCFYHGKVLNDDNPSVVSLMGCQGHGLKGLIKAHGRTLAIKPSQPHVDIDATTTPKVHDEHIVYHISDVDRSIEHSTGCDVGHEMEVVPKHMEQLKEDHPELHAHILEHHSHHHEEGDDDHHHHHEKEDDHHHHHEEGEDDHHHHYQNEHGENENQHDHNNYDSKKAEFDKKHEDVLQFLEKDSGVTIRRRTLDKSKQRYVETLVVNDPARTVYHFGCDAYDESAAYIPEACHNLVLDSLQIFSTVTALYKNQQWDYNFQIVVTDIENWWSHQCPVNDQGTPYNNKYCSSGEYITMPYSVYNYRHADAAAYGCESHADWWLRVNGVDQNGDLRGPSTFRSGEAKSGTNGYCEASYVDYLSRWHMWRLNSGVAPRHDNGQLLSYYDFYNSVIGYASLETMCGSYSGGVNQMTYDQEYNAGIIAHEMGHNWGMRHDSDGNSCSPSQYIMASTGNPNGVRPQLFSSCSEVYLNEFFENRQTALVCLENVPLSPQYGVCGNGFLEQGEQCDCGKEDCSEIDPCCDGQLCALRPNCECSSLQACCQLVGDICTIITESEAKVCRAKSTLNTCDISLETCDGVSPECPMDLFKIAGKECFFEGVGTESIPDGVCWDGECRSPGAYCLERGGYTKCGNVRDVRVDYCWKVRCSNDDGCVDLPISSDADDTGTWPEGTPCKYPQGPNGSQKGICRNGDISNSNMALRSSCVLEDDMIQTLWWADPFGECSSECYPSSCDTNDGEECDELGCVFSNGECNPPAPGEQTREVYCVRYDGTRVADSDCDELSKPNTESDCNKFPCGTCTLDCGNSGTCTYVAGTNQTFSATTATAICVCRYGYSGEGCGVAPTVQFIGVTSVKKRWQALEDDPDCVANDLSTLCEPKIFNLGDTISYRWNTTGTPDWLGVGIRKVGDEFAFYPPNEAKPLYQNKVLLGETDNNGNPINCDTQTTYTPSCDDASFYFDPNSGYNGDYVLEIRYNNEAYVDSPILKVECVDQNCINGVCSSNGCACDSGYSGHMCDQNLCTDWVFINSSVSATDATVSSNVHVDHCHDNGDCSLADGTCTCNNGYSGQYCEISDACASSNTYPTCEHGSVLVFNKNSCAASCDCNAPNRISSSTSHWSGESCSTCSLNCQNGGEPDANCETCINCDPTFLGDRCQYLYWVANFKLDIPYNKISSTDKESFRLTLLKDIAYAVGDSNFPSSKLEIYSMKPAGASTQIYFSIIFPTGDTITAQSYGGAVMLRLQNLVFEGQSTWYRGLATKKTDPAMALTYCIPEFENCDPDVEDKFMEYFLYCIAGSFGFEILVWLIWWFATRKRRWAEYQTRVKTVHARLEMLQDANQAQGGRHLFKFRSVTRAQARKIYEANLNREKIERDLDEKKKEKEEEKQSKAKKPKKKKDKNKHRGEGEPHSGSDLPPNWVEFEDGGIPYYYNKVTEESSWVHPSQR